MDKLNLREILRDIPSFTDSTGVEYVLKDNTIYSTNTKNTEDEVIHYTASVLNHFLDEKGCALYSELYDFLGVDNVKNLEQAYIQHRFEISLKTADTEGFHFKHKINKLRKDYKEENIPKFFEKFKTEITSHFTSMCNSGHFQFQYDAPNCGSHEFAEEFINHLKKNGFIKENGFELSTAQQPNRINVTYKHS